MKKIWKVLAILSTGISDVVWGMHYGYPLCCSIRFGWDRRDNAQSALNRGFTTENGTGWVPCNWFHLSDDYPKTAEVRKKEWQALWDDQMKAKYG